MNTPIDAGFIADENAKLINNLQQDYAVLKEQQARRQIDIDDIKQQIIDFSVAIPSWGVGTGGTRFARFPGQGEPRNVFEKIEDCGVIQQLSRITKTVSPHFPWDKVDDYRELYEHAQSYGLAFDAVNSNTFQDQKNQTHSYKFGSLTHCDAAVRDQAVQHNIECVEIGKQLKSTAITVWIADGSNFAGQHDFSTALDRYLDSVSKIYSALPNDWRLFIEHKLFEPAFYSTVIQDWGTSLICAQQLGEQAKCLVDLGHHAPNTNIEMIVARLHYAGKLGGFHFNDSKYGDDDLDTASINPLQLFLIFNELVAAKDRDANFAPAYMMDQSHNVTDPVESLINSADAIARTYARALLIDRKALRHYQESNDVLMAYNTLREAYEIDVSPIVKMARFEAQGAIAPIAVFRASAYRDKAAKQRPAGASPSSGIV